MSESEKVINNIGWRFAERFGAKGVELIVSIFLARLLSPTDYGTIALMTVFIAILQVFVDSGLGTALIQKKNADNVDFSTVFYTNIIFCSILYLILFLLSPMIAEFYGDSMITLYMRVLGITVLIAGVKNVQQAYVSKNMLFKRFFFATLGGTLLAGVCGVIMALNGFGVWALIVQQVVNVFTDTVILWITVKWRPNLVFSLKRLKSLFTYGWKLLVSALLDTLYNNVRQLLIGKLYSSSDLAQYNRGKQFPQLIATNLNASIDSVLLPAMAGEQDKKEKLKSMTKRSIKISIYLMAPLMLGLACTGESVVGLILTEKWLPCVPYMVVFCITFMFYPMNTANLNAIKAMGRSDIFLKLEIEKKVIGIIAILITMFISVEAMAYSLLVTSLLGQIINAFPNKKLLNYGYKEQLLDILPIIIIASIMGIIVYPIKYLNLGYLVTLIIQVILGAIIYLLGSIFLKIDSYSYLIQTIKKFKLKK